MAGNDFFEKIRGTAIVSLYNNDMAWAHFGYEGDAWKEGGYLTRGFNDLNWLPDPPADASPHVGDVQLCHSDPLVARHDAGGDSNRIYDHCAG